jgi:hypothetical protein
VSEQLLEEELYCGGHQSRYYRTQLFITLDLTTNSTINTYTGYFFSPIKNAWPLKKGGIWKSGTFCFIEQAFLTKYGLSGMSALWYR